MIKNKKNASPKNALKDKILREVIIIKMKFKKQNEPLYNNIS